MEDEGEGSGGQAHADGIEEERGDIVQRILDDDKRRTPNERDQHEQEMSLERAGHGGRVANWVISRLVRKKGAASQTMAYLRNEKLTSFRIVPTICPQARSEMSASNRDGFRGTAQPVHTVVLIGASSQEPLLNYPLARVGRLVGTP